MFLCHVQDNVIINLFHVIIHLYVHIYLNKPIYTIGMDWWTFSLESHQVRQYVWIDCWSRQALETRICCYQWVCVCPVEIDSQYNQLVLTPNTLHIPFCFRAEKIYENYSNFRAIISHKGFIHWEPGGVFKTMCPIDITYYPFDKQECKLMFGAWSYHTSKMNLTTIKSKINMDSYNGNGEWEIVNHLAKRDEFAYECCPHERFAYVAFHVCIRRRHTFYILNIILPSILTSVLLLSIFFCTPGQKVQIGVVVLLSFRIFLLNVSDNIPKTSDHIPLLGKVQNSWWYIAPKSCNVYCTTFFAGIYLTCTMAITTLSMVLTVFILNLHHVTDRPVPPWVCRLILIYVAKIVGKCSTGRETRQSIYSRTKRFFSFREKGKTSKNTGRRAQLRIVSDVTVEEVNDSSDQGTSIDINSSKQRCRYKISNGEPRDTPTENDSLIARQRPQIDYSKDWQQVAEVCDRLFFWLFLLAIVISTLVLFHPLTGAFEKPWKLLKTWI